jgi:hypothetical protein
LTATLIRVADPRSQFFKLEIFGTIKLNMAEVQKKFEQATEEFNAIQRGIVN